MRIYQDRGEKNPCHYSQLDSIYGECYEDDGVYDLKSFGYPECSDQQAMSKYYSSGGMLIKPCYHKADYKGAVDIGMNEGFTVDEISGKFEMCVQSCCLKLQRRFGAPQHFLN